MLPAILRGKADAPVYDDSPNNTLNQRYGNTKQEGWNCESPWRVEHEVPLLVNDWKPYDRERKIGIPIKHVNEQTTQNCPDIDGTIYFIPFVHCLLKIQSCANKCNK